MTSLPLDIIVKIINISIYGGLGKRIIPLSFINWRKILLKDDLFDKFFIKYCVSKKNVHSIYLFLIEKSLSLLKILLIFHNNLIYFPC